MMGENLRDNYMEFNPLYFYYNPFDGPRRMGPGLDSLVLNFEANL